MRGLYLIKDGVNYMEFHDWNDIPMEFDNLIRFEPEVPPPPHTDEQHEELEMVHNVFKEIILRERTRGNNNR
jgi:hypothetical protein